MLGYVFCASLGKANPTYTLLPKQQRQALQATLASYYGHFRHAQSRRLLEKVHRRFPWLQQVFTVQEDRLIVRWQPLSVTSFYSQWLYFRQQWPEAVILIQLGGACYAFEQDAVRLARLFSQRKQAPPRRPFRQSFNVFLTPLYKQLLPLLRSRSVPYCLVLEEGYLKGGLKRRVLHELFYPPRVLYT